MAPQFSTEQSTFKTLEYILRRKELEDLKNFSLKLDQNRKLRIFLLQFCEVSMIL